ncbi:MAG: hypothetical protein ACYSYV_08525 [Planctomycetota bacterium]|jgi:hypothetical protein
MFNTVIKSMFMLTILAGAMTQAQQINAELYQQGKGKWEDISLPRAYVLMDVNSIPDDAEHLSESTVERYFRHLRWKQDVQLFEYYVIGPKPRLLARLGDKISWISPENIGYFIENMDSEAQVLELVMFFHRGLLLSDQPVVEALIGACRDSKVGKVAKSIPKSSEPLCCFDKKHAAWRVSFCMYENRNVFEVKYLVASNGLMGRTFQNYIIGPKKISGWDDKSPGLEQYEKTSEEFRRAIAEPLETAAIRLLRRPELNKRGLVKARVNAFRWLLSWADVQQHAPLIREFMNAENSAINPRLRSLALRKLK